MLSRGKWQITPPAKWHSHNESHHGHRWVEVCSEPIINGHIASVHMAGSKCWDCQAKYSQTPYQFMDVMNPAGRRSLLASSGPLDVPLHIRNGASVCMQGGFLRELRRAHSTSIQRAHRGQMKREWAGLYGATAGKCLLHNNNTIWWQGLYSLWITGQERCKLMVPFYG